ncbi:MAG: alpha/beta hydrolase [Flammeovirgaceae bacterium]|nr:MAG: alpha/beta hydrolase [Flammeovirgaceae bacterium]
MLPVYFTDQGKGFPVVFLHGFCETNQIWQGVVAHLQDSWRLLAVDLPGFGNSKLSAVPESLDEIADAIIQWLESIRVSRCIVFGHSLGGYITLAIAQKRPDLLAAFGLVHSTAYADTEEKKANRNRVVEFVKEHGVNPFIESFIPPLFANLQHPRIAEVVSMGKTTPLQTLIAYTHAMRDRPDRTDLLADFKGKVLLLAGEHDRLISVESIAEQAQRCQQPVFTVLQGVAHMGMLEDEAGIIRVLRLFLDSVEDI